MIFDSLIILLDNRDEDADYEKSAGCGKVYSLDEYYGMGMLLQLYMCIYICMYIRDFFFYIYINEYV